MVILFDLFCETGGGSSPFAPFADNVLLLCYSIIIILKNIFNINAILMLINGCHGKTEDAEEKIVPLNEVSD